MTSSTFRTDAVFSRVARWWRCRPWNTNSLMRWPDRLGAAVRLLAVVVVLAAVPVAGAVGSVAYSDDAARIRVEHAQTTAVEALVLDRPEYTSLHIRQAEVTWTGASGPVVATVPVSRTVDKGDRISVWLNRSGDPVDAPRPPIAAVMNAIGVTVLIMAGAGLAAWCSITCAEWFATRRHFAALDRQMPQLDR
ncbi:MULTISPECIES: Rv1733c family protein [unclassified Nocardia]|uniref:Rv1733c family protein n=1 Tax=unclassified Nocardia TaxID=2637762 RepID=UPI00366CBE38